MFSTLLMWLARLIIAVQLVLALMPLIPIGAWWIRLSDFPRLQLTMLLTIPITLLLIVMRYQGLNREILFLFSLIFLIAIWEFSHIAPFTPLWKKELADATDSSPPPVRLMVVNLEKENKEHQAVLTMLQQQAPDILLLIENDEAWEKELEPLAQKMPYRKNVPRGEGLGIALWSKFPLHDVEVRYLISERRASIFAIVEMPQGQRVRMAGVHPTPPGLHDSTPGGRRNSRVRDAELVLVAKEVQKDPEKIWIITGDFNDVAWSHTTRLFKRLSGLHDPRVGRQMLNSFHADYPLLRYPIDHVFLSQGFQIHGLDRIRTPGSDHFAIQADVSVPFGDRAQPHPTEQDQEEAEEMVEEGHEDAVKRDIAPQTQTPSLE